VKYALKCQRVTHLSWGLFQETLGGGRPVFPECCALSDMSPALYSHIIKWEVDSLMNGCREHVFSYSTETRKAEQHVRHIYLSYRSCMCESSPHLSRCVSQRVYSVFVKLPTFYSALCDEKCWRTTALEWINTICSFYKSWRDYFF